MKVTHLAYFIGFCIASILLLTNNTYAQYVEIKTNQTEDKPTDSVIIQEDISKLFEKDPNTYYTPYFDSMIERKKFKIAEKVVLDKLKQSFNQPDPQLFIDLGNVYLKLNKETKAKEQFDKALKMVNGDDMLTKRLAKSFLEIGRIDYAIHIYERATNILMNPNIYSGVLANLYTQNGQLEKAIEFLFIRNPGLNVNVDYTKTILLQILGNDPVKLQQVQKIVINKINEQPENIYFVDILTWIYTQKNDWDGALLQIEAIDERNKEQGKRLIEFARTAANDRQFDIADKAYNDVLAKGRDMPYFMVATSEQMSTNLARLKNDPGSANKGIIDSIIRKYDNYSNENLQFNSAETASEYAQIEALYANNAEKGILILQSAITRPDIRRDQVGRLKLQMGDYYLLLGKIWDASLTYSQVDKEFKQDLMGEDARFRNAKLAYYRGDFDWAQRQLLILKSATSELIANDALALSVLITENVEDSNTYPLRRFAYADLLLAQNKDSVALQLLDSITNAFPKHPLVDDILMLHAKIAEKHHDYEKALLYLDKIYKEYGTDVLGDDAVFKKAEIYQINLHDKEKAKQYYEQLIIEYPGSTLIQTARQRLHDINVPIAP